MRVLKTGLTFSIRSMAVSPCGRWLAAHPGWDMSERRNKSRPVCVWDLRNLDARPKQIRSRKPEQVLFLPTGDLLVRDFGKPSVSVRPFPGNGEPRIPFPEHSVYGVCVDPTGRTLFASTSSRILVWDLKRWQPGRNSRNSWTHEDCLVRLPAFHPDGVRAAAFASKNVKLGEWKHFLCLFEHPGGKPLRAVEVRHNWPRDPVFSPDGKLLAAADPNALIVWDADTLEEAVRVEPKLACPSGDTANRRLSAPVFTPDGRFLAVGCYDGTVRLYDTTNWAEATVYDWGRQVIPNKLDIDRGTAAVGELAFTPDGTLGVARVAYDLVVWDMDG